MTQQEKYVRSRWVDVYDCGGCVYICGFHGRILFTVSRPTSVEAWQAAYDFTVDQEEEIRQLEEEIAALLPFAAGRTEEALTLMPVWAKATIPALLSEGKAILRTVARLRQAITELKCAMKEMGGK
jgi:hypothetical protein